MTASDWKKAYKQLKNKPAKWEKYKKHNKPKERSCATDENVKCRRCNRSGGIIRKYDINLCRQCFSEIAPKLGFKKYD